MTREDAIMELNQFSGTTQLKLSANFWTALNMAIKALDQEPCEMESGVCKGCHYNDGEVHAECVVCDKAEMESEE